MIFLYLLPEDLEPYIIYIDKRENKSRISQFKCFIVDHLNKNRDKLRFDNKTVSFNGLKEVNLEIGDYAFKNGEYTVGIEYKNSKDFYLSALGSNEAFREFIDLLNNYYQPLLMVENNDKKLLSNERVQGVFDSICTGIPLRVVDNQSSAFRCMLKNFIVVNDHKGIPHRFMNRNYNPAVNSLYYAAGGHLTWNMCIRAVNKYNIHCIEDIDRLTLDQIKELPYAKMKSGNYHTSYSRSCCAFNSIHGISSAGLTEEENLNLLKKR